MKQCVIREGVLEVLDAALSIPMLVFNAEEIIYSNVACRKMFGYRDSLFNNFNMGKILIDEDIVNAATYHDIWNEYQRFHTQINKEVHLFKTNGEEIVVECNGKIVEYEDEKYIMMQFYDITEKKKIEVNLLHLSMVHALMLEISQSVVKSENINVIYDLILRNALRCIENSDLGSVFLLDGDVFRIAAYNGFSAGIEDFILPKKDSTLYVLTEGRMDEIKYMGDLSSFDRFFPVETQLKESKLIQATISTPIIIKGELFGMINIDSFKKNIFTDEDLRTMQFIKNSVEIAISNHLLYEKARYLAKYDSLTDLYNRTYFRESFNKIDIQCRKKEKFFQVVVFDLNNLKKINDICGHHAGDIAIKATADALKKTLGCKDFVARIGGDEFCAVYFNLTQNKLEEKLECCLAELEQADFCEEGEKIKVSFSYGIAQFPEDGTDYERLSKVADERMYRYKKAYKECRK